MPATSLQARGMMPSLTVNDIEKSIKFYRDGLGFAVKEEWKDDGKLMGVMLDAGGAVLGISQDDFAKGRDRVKGVGLRLHLETTQDVNALAEQAKSHGIRLADGPGQLPWGSTGFTVTDPDGFKLTIENPM